MLHIRTMTLADVPAGMRLKDMAGWNQLEVDWIRALDLEPGGCFLAEIDGLEVGTVTTCRFGDVGWVAMMLVDPNFRRQGIGKALMERAIGYLEELGVRSIRLDATPMGQPLYEKLGFVPQYQLIRHAGMLPANPPVDGVIPFTLQHLNSMLALDEHVVQAERHRYILQLYHHQPQAVRFVLNEEGSLQGFMMARPGALAWQLGPCIAEDEAGAMLLADAWHQYAGKSVFLDIAVHHEQASQMAKAQGLTEQRRLQRMSRGQPVIERFPEMWVSSGPAKG